MIRKRYSLAIWPLAVMMILGLSRLSLEAQQDPLKEVLQAEAKRVEVVQKVTPSVVAIFAKGGKGGGSGVLISKDGYALTNYHVVKPAGALMKCGLANGVVYDAVLVGWDMVGDVALIKLLPKKEGDEFTFAPLADSDKVKKGDWSLAMGNPFLLATDFTPTVTFGMVSGTNRYQYPAGTILEYTDCIQIDASINPGNSGGPLYNMEGEVIGINGRGSFDKRGRVNSGVGYAISINQIKNFMGHLRGGLNADHATLGAAVITQTEQDGHARLVFTQVLPESDAARRKVDYGDELISFDGRPMSSVNQFKNVVGIYPRGWRVPMVYRHGSSLNEVLVRLMGVIPKEVGGKENGKEDGKDGDKKPAPKPIIKPSGPAAKYYQPKKGFVNHYFNKLEKDRVLNNFKKQSDFSKQVGDWTLFGTVKLKHLAVDAPIKIEIKQAKDGKAANPDVRMTVNNFPFRVEPLNQNFTLQELQQPSGSGGFLVALYLYQRLLTQGESGFSVKCDYAGHFPYYPPDANGKNPASWKLTKKIGEAIDTRFGPYETRWYFSPEDQKLVAFEVWLQNNVDPCEVYLSDYRQVRGQWLPHQMQVRHGDGTYGTVSLNNMDLGAAK